MRVPRIFPGAANVCRTHWQVSRRRGGGLFVRCYGQRLSRLSRTGSPYVNGNYRVQARGWKDQLVMPWGERYVHVRICICNLAPSEIDRLGEKSAGNNIARRRDTQKNRTGKRIAQSCAIIWQQTSCELHILRVSFKEFNRCRRRLITINCDETWFGRFVKLKSRAYNLHP